MSLSKIKRISPIFAALMLCSCAQQPHTVIYNDLNYGSLEGTLVLSSDDEPELEPETEASVTNAVSESKTDTSPASSDEISGLTGTNPPASSTTPVSPEAAASSFVTTATSAEPEPSFSPTASDVSAADTTSAVTSAAAPAPTDLPVPASKRTKYSFEYQETNGSLTIAGPNLVYVGESFDFNYSYPDKPEDAYIVWSVEGDAGEADRYGNFTALKRGTVIITVSDETNGIYASLKVHCIKPGDDVDFLPLVNGIPIANKTYPLPKDYDPGFSNAALSAFRELQAAAYKEGLNIYIISSYRSYSYQKQVYSGWVNIYGDSADDISARPGHSEHQLGLAIDVNSCDFSFADTPEGKWLKEHCAEYGFIIRYPSQKAKVYTGYSYEPWHIRYLGKQLAKTVTESGKTLEECLGIDSYYR